MYPRESSPKTKIGEPSRSPLIPLHPVWFKHTRSPHNHLQSSLLRLLLCFLPLTLSAYLRRG
jgi:hypothetical protein